jgi:flagellar hook assembly protein FlgD
VEVYNIRGELVRRLKMTDSEAIWDGRNSSGVDCPSGVYLLRSNDVRNRVKKISKIN